MLIIINLQLEREREREREREILRSTKSIYFKFTHFRFKVH